MTDFTLHPTTTRYDGQNALSLGKAAQLAYRNSTEIQQRATAWGFPQYQFFDKRETQAYVIGNDTMIVTAQRTALDYLLAPIERTFSRGMREK